MSDLDRSGPVRPSVGVLIDPDWRDRREAIERCKGRGASRDEGALSARGIAQRLLALSGFGARGRGNARRLRIEHVEHTVRAARGSDAPLRILQLSDPHFPEIRDHGYEATLHAAIANTPHDVLVLTGDYRDRSVGPFDGALAALAHIIRASDAPVCAVLGNHDPAAIVEPLARLGVHALINRHVRIPLHADRVELAVAGVDDPSRYRLHDIHAALAGIPAGLPTVLLAHSPVVADVVPDDRVQLCLCGHTHGGQINAPGGRVLRIAPAVREVAPDTVVGAWRRGALAGYTSAGTGTSVLDARFFCPPELVLHRVRIEVPAQAHGWTDVSDDHGT